MLVIGPGSKSGAYSSWALHYLAEQEAAIRTNPAARTTELLQKVFGK